MEDIRKPTQTNYRKRQRQAYKTLTSQCKNDSTARQAGNEIQNHGNIMWWKTCTQVSCNQRHSIWMEECTHWWWYSSRTSRTTGQYDCYRACTINSRRSSTAGWESVYGDQAGFGSRHFTTDLIRVVKTPEEDVTTEQYPLRLLTARRHALSTLHVTAKIHIYQLFMNDDTSSQTKKEKLHQQRRTPGDAIHENCARPHYKQWYKKFKTVWAEPWKRLKDTLYANNKHIENADLCMYAYVGQRYSTRKIYLANEMQRRIMAASCIILAMTWGATRKKQAENLQRKRERKKYVKHNISWHVGEGTIRRWRM